MPGFLAGLSAGLLAGSAGAADPPMSTGAWTLVHIPDTQNYVSSPTGAAILTTQMQWIASRAGSRNIRFAVHVGDVVNDNDVAQWSRARSAFDHVIGVVPFALCSGNHDCGPGGSGNSRETLFTHGDYFGADSPYAGQPTFRGLFNHPADAPGNTQNSWHTFRAGGVDHLVLTCEWGPRDQVVNWIAEMARTHRFHRVMIVVHAYLKSSTIRYDWKLEADGVNPHAYGIASDPDGVNDGGEIWEKVGRRFENVCLIVCGHSTRGLMTSRGDNGNLVHQLLFNTQDFANGGDGWLRLFEFLPDDRTVLARTFSTHLDQSSPAPADEFTLELSPVSSLDSDLDLMPDYFESRYQLDPDDATDADGDPDADGMTNRDEFLATTNPRNARSRLDVTSFRPGSASPGALRWSSVPGMAYDVQSNASIDPAGWTHVDTVTASDWATTLAIPAAMGERRFYRVVTVPK
jgi:hypothetical protein